MVSVRQLEVKPAEDRVFDENTNLPCLVRDSQGEVGLAVERIWDDEVFNTNIYYLDGSFAGEMVACGLPLRVLGKGDSRTITIVQED